MLLEIAVFDLASAIAAAAAGADRIELCANPADGGTTPSYGILKIAREKIDVPVFPIIRPRGGDFLYNDEELAAIRKDISLCKELGFEGIVTGALTADGHIHADELKVWTELAYPMEVTFHRAFDRASDPLGSLETLISCGCSRVLTSGQYPVAGQGKELIKQLVELADERIIILPGSGIRSSNLLELIQFTGAKEWHSSARKAMPTGMQYLQASMQEDLHKISVDTEEIRAMKQILRELTH